MQLVTPALYMKKVIQVKKVQRTKVNLPYGERKSPWKCQALLIYIKLSTKWG